jgi:hypothetical protein
VSWALALFGFASGVLADQALDRIAIKSTPDKAWAAIGDFCGIKDWHPDVEACELQHDGKALFRVLSLKNGGKVVELEISRNDRGRAYAYRIAESPWPVENYTATLRVLPMEGGRVDIIWASAFKPIGPAAAAKKKISEIYSAGLKSLKAKLEAKSK